MNEYQEALNNVKKAPGFMGGNGKYKSNLQSSIPFLEDISILQELVDKQTTRTEKEVLQDFEKLGWKVVNNTNAILLLSMNDFEIDIRKYGKKYTISNWDYIDMQEHKLLNELFQIWNWL